MADDIHRTQVGLLTPEPETEPPSRVAGRYTLQLGRARELAERAIALGPDRGEAWHALAVERAYSNDLVGAAQALKQVLVRSPGHAAAQYRLGAMLLEAGELDDARIRLHAALALDPTLGDARLELVRAHAMLGDWDQVLALLRDHAREEDPVGRTVTWARLRLWHPELPPTPPIPEAETGAIERRRFVNRIVAFLTQVVEQRRMPPSTPDIVEDGVQAEVGRLHVGRLQFQIEALLFTGQDRPAEELIDRAAELGLVDLAWLDRCPLLAPIRSRPAFARARAQVAARAAEVVAAAS